MFAFFLRTHAKGFPPPPPPAGSAADAHTLPTPRTLRSSSKATSLPTYSLYEQLKDANALNALFAQQDYEAAYEWILQLDRPPEEDDHERRLRDALEDFTKVRSQARDSFEQGTLAKVGVDTACFNLCRMLYSPVSSTMKFTDAP